MSFNAQRNSHKSRKMSSLSADEKQALDTLAVNNFCEYLRIPSVHPNVNYGKYIKNINKQLFLVIDSLRTSKCYPVGRLFLLMVHRNT